MDQQHKLVGDDGNPIEIGTQVTDFRGKLWTLTDWTAPRHAASTGRVYLRAEDDEREFFPGVINAKIVDI
jgi:hypothetical protein